MNGVLGHIGLMGGSVCVLAVGLSLFFAQMADARSLRLSDLHKPQADALCADPAWSESGEERRPGSGDEPVAWCADPTSPQCLPALPPHASPDFHDVQPATFGGLVELPRNGDHAIAATPWQRPDAERVPSSRDADPLERPPRA
jgi:hypothetical protein